MTFVIGLPTRAGRRTWRRTSDRPKKPMMMASSGTPSNSQEMPKVSRATPSSGSIPIWVRSSPKTTMSRPLRTEEPRRPAARQRLSTISEKYSGGPRRSASRLMATAVEARISVEKQPPMKEPMAEIASAGPARPCLASGWPSKVVTTVSDSPGTFMRMLVSVPP